MLGLHMQQLAEATFAVAGQLLIAALLDQFPLLHHQHLIGVANGRQAVGDDNNGHLPF